MDNDFLDKLLQVRVKCIYVDFEFEKGIWKPPQDTHKGLHNDGVNVIMAAREAEEVLIVQKSKLKIE